MPSGRGNKKGWYMATDFDLTIRNGRVCTEEGVREIDIGVNDGVISVLKKNLPKGKKDIDASGRLVLPGGIDSHCHVEQLSALGVMCADDFYTASRSAAFGGTTTIIPFAAQHRGNSLMDVVGDYSERAARKSIIDYGFHLILSDPTEQALKHDLPALIRQGITSFKVFMTYDRLKLDDYQLLDVLDVAGREGALVMVHAESSDMIRWLTRKLIERGLTSPRYHAVAHNPLAESEATNRAIVLSRLIGVPIMIVHVAGIEAVQVIHAAQVMGAPIYAESCPQYLFLTGKDIDIPGVEAAKYCCSPPPRDQVSQQAVWDGLCNGTLQVFSSDHAPYRFDETGKLPDGDNTSFKNMANGLPGIELRLPLLFSEGVLTGKISVEKFVDLIARNHAITYGLYPKKGVIKVGSDADIAIWNSELKVKISANMLHDNVGYTPYEGKEITGWPEIIISRGRIIVKDGQLHAQAGDGQYIPRKTPGPVLKNREEPSKGLTVKKYF